MMMAYFMLHLLQKHYCTRFVEAPFSKTEYWEFEQKKFMFFMELFSSKQPATGGKI
jgi:hypothetical protein